MKSPVKILASSFLAASALTLSASVPVQAQNAGERNVCLNVTEIKSTQAVDRQTIMFRMRDGKVWRNDLATPCPDLVAHSAGGYTQRAHTDWICANTQQIKAQSGMVCRLGEFTRVN